MQGLFNRFQQFENNEIDCYFQNEQMYFIDFNARLWPCCFIRNSEFGGHNTHWHQVKSIMHDVYNDNDWNRLDLHSVDEILEHPFYKKDIEDSFEKDYGMEEVKHYPLDGNRFVEACKACKISGNVQGHAHSGDEGAIRYPVIALVEDIRKFEALYDYIKNEK